MRLFRDTLARIVVGFLAATTCLAGAEGVVPQVGAIRWDAWFGGDKGGPARAVEAALGPEKWHYRLPFFAQVTGPDSVHIDGSSQEVMDREIDYAADAGLSYWAFVLYDEKNPMRYGIRNYLASAKRERIKFSLIGTPWWFRNPAYLADIEALMGEKGFLTVFDGRPVVFLGFISDADIKKMWGDEGKARAGIDAFRADCRAKGLQNPYIVILDFNPQKGKHWVDLLGADAISSYVTHGNADDLGGTYAGLSAGVEQFWNQCRATGAQVVPIAVASADRRPRVEHPVPWEAYQKPGAGIEKYFQQPKPEEVGAQMGSALRWLRDNRAAAQSQLILTYAWNENDEGGWLVPTLSEGTARLDAVAKAIAADRSASAN